MRKQTTLFVGLGAASLALTACGGVSTSTGDDEGGDYPSGTVEMYVGAPAGGSSDLISRAVSKGLSDELGASFPVINKEGSNGALAAAEVAKAKPDGSVISIQNASLFAITPLAVSEDEATDIGDFKVLQGISRDDYVMVTNPKGGISDLKDLEAANDKITYGTTGVGTGSQVACALLVGSAGAEGEAVPFDGGAPALAAVLGGQVDTACLQIGEAIENIKADKIVPLTVFGSERVKFLPDVPTAKEQGLDVEVAQYRFMTVPKDTPQEVQDTIIKGLQTTFETEAYKSFNQENSLTPMEVSGEDVVAQLESDKKRYASLVEEFDIDMTE